jgi:hypothetical protein
LMQREEVVITWSLFQHIITVFIHVYNQQTKNNQESKVFWNDNWILFKVTL